MRGHGTLFRFSTAVAVGGLLFGPPLARAQSDTVDPPARVGRLASLTGTVSFHGPGQTEWSPASLNTPITSGDAVWTEPSSAAVIGVGPTHIAMDEATEFDVDTLDDHTLAATAPQGEVYLRVTGMAPGDVTHISTPRGVVTITQPGRYEVDAGNTDDPTTVTVLEGGARIEGAGPAVSVGPQMTAQITGTSSFQTTLVPAVRDPFLTAQLSLERPLPVVAGAVAPPPVVGEMTGGDAVMATGSWVADPQYGEIWYPPVDPGWVPYRDGHWAYILPWGWTWIDDASWGFAPFHYGRWVHEGPRWGWIASEPGVVVSARPYYAPALVSFIGLGVGVTIGASVGWIPLGPREAYYPPYRVSNGYLRDVNARYVPNVAHLTINNTRVINNYVNRGGATMVPGTVMAGSRPVAPLARPATARQLATARVVPATQLRPTAATSGVTPSVARQLHLAPATPGTTPPRRAAPGPAVRPHAAGVVPLRSGAAVSPAARPNVVTGPTGRAAPGPAVQPHAAGVVPLRSGAAVSPAARPNVVTGPTGRAAPGPAVQPHAAGVVPLRSGAAVSPAARPNVVTGPTGRAAPGPAVQPHAAGVVPLRSGAAVSPAARPNVVTGPTGRAAPGPAIAPRGPSAPGGVPASPQSQRPAGAVPHVVTPPAPARAAPQVQRQTAPAVQHAAPPARVAAPQIQRQAAPARPAPQVQRQTAPAVQHAAPQMQRQAAPAAPRPESRPAPDRKPPDQQHP
jgi:hypothetical protein